MEEFYKKLFREAGCLSGGTFDFNKESLKAFLKKAVNDSLKEFSYGCRKKSTANFSRSPIDAFLQEILKKNLRDPLAKIPKELLEEILKQFMEDIFFHRKLT